MKNIEESEVFLAKWLAGELTEEEHKMFKESEDYLLFEKIAINATEFERPVFKKEETFQKIQEQIAQKQKKTSVITMKTFMGIAASIALLLGVFFFMNNNTVKTATYGEQLAFYLPDSSKVILNAKSSISYNENHWSNNRTLSLDGEAYFKVKKGSSFIVNSNEGTVTVLGTEFSVLEEEDLLKVTCYEGKVKVKRKHNTVILTKGMSFKQYSDSIPVRTTTEVIEPAWVGGKTVFKSAPLKYVLIALEKQYDIKFKNKHLKENKLFTGSFVHANLNVALQSVLLPMNLEYEIVKKGKEVVIK